MSKKGTTLPLVLLLIIGGLVIAGGVGGYVYVGSNQFCAYKCHQMSTRGATWRKSSHKEVKCITCHSEPGFVGEIKAHIDGLNYLKSFLKDTTTHSTIFATKRNPARLKSCLYCHPAEKLQDETETIRMYHATHVVKEKLLCTDCHQDSIHGTLSPEKEMMRPRERVCLSCHLTVGAPTNCESCHVLPVVRGRRQVYGLDALEEPGVRPKGDN
ncbi:MAG: hypothetical protein DSY83_13215 [Flavobacteriia bacterium]|nr:MAG: hypothetical protein DSY83_13215 [Flavobacteriia bacterium]